MPIYCNILIISNINLKQNNIKVATKLHLDNLCKSCKPISIPDGFSDIPAPPLPLSTKIFNFTE